MELRTPGSGLVSFPFIPVLVHPAYLGHPVYLGHPASDLARVVAIALSQGGIVNPVGLGSGADLIGLFTQGGLAATSQDASMSTLKKSLDSAASTGEALAAQVAQVGHISVYA
jgi:hypothetical protein